MEFEIWNDILTLTVNEVLFDEKTPTPKIENDNKNERLSRASRGSRNSRGGRSIGSFLSRGDSMFSRESEAANSRAQSRSSIESKMSNGGRRTTNNQRGGGSGTVGLRLRENCSPEEWLSYNAPLLLNESLKKLSLDLKIIDERNLDMLSRDELLEEKRRVKNELKRYDGCYQVSFGKFPGRQEKEPMRPLYIYYKRLKQAIMRAQANLPQTGRRRGSNTSSGQRQTNNNSNASQDYLDAVEQLEKLRKQRAELRKKLEKYQFEFIKNNNRRIRYRQDIEDVEDDYNLYKSLKEDIKILENKVKELKSRN